MKLRRIPRVPDSLREEPRPLPDEIHLRPYQNGWNETRYLVEARARGCVLGDQDFAQLADARAFAEMEAKWDSARLVDRTRG